MALKATIFKAFLRIDDPARDYHQEHDLTLARHASETDERMMVRLLAFILYADPALAFTKGLGAADEPDLWKKDLTGAIQLWIEVGQPDEKRILKACGRAGQVVVLTYAPGSQSWWDQNNQKLARAKNLTVLSLPPASARLLAPLAERNMRLSCNLADGEISLTSDDGDNLTIQLVTLREAVANPYGKK